MKKNEKIIISILIIITLLIKIIFFVRNRNEEVNEPENENNIESENTVVKEEFVQVLDDGTKLNISDELEKVKNIDGIEISNIQLTHKDGLTVLLADIKNNTGKKTSLKKIDVTLLDKEGKELAKISGLIEEMEIDGTTQLNTVVTSDYANVYDFKVDLK